MQNALLVADFSDYLQYTNMTAEQIRQVFGEYDDYTYEVDFANVPAAGETPQALTIQRDSHFVWEKSVFASFPDNNQVLYSQYPQPNILVDIEDATGTRFLNNAPVPVPSVFGIPGFPYVLPCPRLIRSNTTFRFTLTNPGAVAQNLKLSLIGKKFYRM
jgi:hypothetical protein